MEWTKLDSFLLFLRLCHQWGCLVGHVRVRASLGARIREPRWPRLRSATVFLNRGARTAGTIDRAFERGIPYLPDKAKIPSLPGARVEWAIDRLFEHEAASIAVFFLSGRGGSGRKDATASSCPSGVVRGQREKRKR